MKQAPENKSKIPVENKSADPTGKPKEGVPEKKSEQKEIENK